MTGALWSFWGLIGAVGRGCSVFLRAEPRAKVGPGVPSDLLPRPLVNFFLSTHKHAPCLRFQANSLASFRVPVLISVP